MTLTVLAAGLNSVRDLESPMVPPKQEEVEERAYSVRGQGGEHGEGEREGERRAKSAGMWAGAGSGEEGGGFGELSNPD